MGPRMWRIHSRNPSSRPWKFFGEALHSFIFFHYSQPNVICFAYFYFKDRVFSLRRSRNFSLCGLNREFSEKSSTTRWHALLVRISFVLLTPLGNLDPDTTAQKASQADSEEAAVIKEFAVSYIRNPKRSIFKFHLPFFLYAWILFSPKNSSISCELSNIWTSPSWRIRNQT